MTMDNPALAALNDDVDRARLAAEAAQKSGDTAAYEAAREEQQATAKRLADAIGRTPPPVSETVQQRQQNLLIFTAVCATVFVAMYAYISIGF
jgi:hypothetical protein